MHGQYIWYELTTPDIEGAKAFYPRFTDWGLQAFDENYTMWTTGGAPVAGLFRLTDEMRQQGVPPNWMAYVECDDVDATAAKATSLGGKVVAGPDDIPGTGRFAVVQDPQGAMFGLYKSNMSPSGAWDGTNIVNRFSWHELMTTDYQAAFDFYRGLFGWNETGSMDMGNGDQYFMFGQGDKMYGGMFNRPSEMAAMPPFWLMYIHVSDVAKAVTKAVKAGATIIRPQLDIPGGSIAILADPQGAGFAVHATTPTPAAPKPAAKKSVKKAAKKAAKRVAKVAKTVAKAAKKAAKKVAKVAKKAVKKSSTAAKKAPRKAKVAAKKVATKAKSKTAKVKKKAAGRRR